MSRHSFWPGSAWLPVRRQGHSGTARRGGARDRVRPLPGTGGIGGGKRGQRRLGAVLPPMRKDAEAPAELGPADPGRKPNAERGETAGGGALEALRVRG